VELGEYQQPFEKELDWLGAELVQATIEKMFGPLAVEWGSPHPMNLSN
jgi:hypothetical protein